MTNLKSPLSFKNQVKRMKGFHKIIISDDSKAEDILSNVNYYKLLGYGIGLTNPLNKDEYVNCTIEKLYKLYTFDSKFRNIIQLYLEYVEIEFKTRYANYFSLKYGSEAYTNVNLFANITKADGTDVHSNIIEGFKKEVERHKSLPFVKHHNDVYGGHFPFWVAVELITFGDIVSFYRISKAEDKLAIAKLYNTDAQYLSGWLLSFVEVRNICAHNNRLYNIKLKQKPYLYKSKNYRKEDINKEKIFPLILTLRRFFECDERWIKLRDDIIKLIEEYDTIINLTYLGFPKEWKKILLQNN